MRGILANGLNGEAERGDPSFLVDKAVEDVDPVQDVIRAQEQGQAVELRRQIYDVKHFDEEKEEVEIVAVMAAHANVLFGFLTTSLLRVVVRDAHEPMCMRRCWIGCHGNVTMTTTSWIREAREESERHGGTNLTNEVNRSRQKEQSFF